MVSCGSIKNICELLNHDLLCMLPLLQVPCTMFEFHWLCLFLTCRAHVVSVGYLLQGNILDVKGLWWVVLLLRVNHTWELGLRAHCHPSTLPLETNSIQYGLAKMNWAAWGKGFFFRKNVYCLLIYFPILLCWCTKENINQTGVGLFILRMAFICFHKWTPYCICFTADSLLYN